MASIPFTAVFAVECAMVMFTTKGTKILNEKKLYILEVFLQALSVYAYIKMYAPDGAGSDS